MTHYRLFVTTSMQVVTPNGCSASVTTQIIEFNDASTRELARQNLLEVNRSNTSGSTASTISHSVIVL